MRPEGYPLPWCEELGVPYWRINLWLCGYPAWSEWQSGLPMAEIIPEIDELLAATRHGGPAEKSHGRK